MKTKILTLLTLIFLSINCIGQDDTATEKGKNIGNVINAALETVVPGVPALMNIIWPKDKKDTDKIKKEELEKAVTTAKNELTKSIKTKMLSEISPLSEVGIELSVYNQFLEPSIPARSTLGKMKYMIGNETDPLKIDWVSIDIEWTTIADEIDKILKVDKKTINALSGIYGRTTLKNIQTNSGNLKVKITKRILEKKKPRIMILRIDELMNTLASLDSTMGILLSDLQDGFLGLKKTTTEGFTAIYKAHLDSFPEISKFTLSDFNELSIEQKTMFANYSEDQLAKSFILTADGGIPQSILDEISQLKQIVE